MNQPNQKSDSDHEQRLFRKTLSQEHIAPQAEQSLESGIVGAFRFFIIIRLVLWLMLYLSDAATTGRPELSALGVQILIVTSVIDMLTLVAITWPRIRSKIDKHIFGWLLVLSTLTLFFGHARVLSFGGFETLPFMTSFYTPYTIFLFTTVLFVAWQYGFRVVLLYGGFVTSILLFLMNRFIILSPERISLTFTMVLLTMLLPGWLIAHLMNQQRQQQAALAAAAEEQARANEKLVHYAASLEELTISRERNRLARELHDTLAHSLSAVTVQLGAVDILWESSSEAAKALLNQADETARSGLEEARRALQALRASPLEDLGLVLALEALVKEAATRAGAALHLDVPEEKLTFLEPHIEQSIYRVAQEALENSVRHAEAKTLWVTLVHSAEQIQLTIRDDGQGFNPSQTAPTGHYGVAGMEERASVVGGTLQVESSQGEGTMVQLVVPLKEFKS